MSRDININNQPPVTFMYKNIQIKPKERKPIILYVNSGCGLILKPCIDDNVIISNGKEESMEDVSGQRTT